MPLRDLTVAEVMHEDVEVTASDAPLAPLLQSIETARNGCYLVVDEGRRPVGIVTGGDLLGHLIAGEPIGGSYLKAVLTAPDALRSYLHAAGHAHGDRVRDVMSSPVLTVEPGDNLQHTAELFASTRVRRLAVVRDGMLVGLIRRTRIVAQVARLIEAQPSESSDASEQR